MLGVALVEVIWFSPLSIVGRKGTLKVK